MRWAGVDVRYDVGWTDEVWLLRARSYVCGRAEVEIKSGVWPPGGRWGLEVNKMLWYVSWHY
jgi:hypothetical protein